MAGDEVLIWVNETGGGAGLTAKAHVASYRPPNQISIRDAELFSDPLLNNEALQKCQGTIFKDIISDARSRLRSLSQPDVNELLAAANYSSIAVDIKNVDKDRTVDGTTRKALIDARCGQGKFRRLLEKRWNRACAATGCQLREVLRASHIKPWSNSTNDERLDPGNGLLLIANLDALFDRGLISFDDNGEMIVSIALPAAERDRLGLPVRLRRKLKKKEKNFLVFHRTIFKLAS